MSSVLFFVFLLPQLELSLFLFIAACTGTCPAFLFALLLLELHGLLRFRTDPVIGSDLPAYHSLHALWVDVMIRGRS